MARKKGTLEEVINEKMKEWESLSNNQLEEVAKELEKEIKEMANGGMNDI